MGKFQDLTGKKFGKLKVIKISGRDKQGNILWLCECECGNKILARTSGLNAGKICSCGCQRIKSITKHGLRYTRLYRIMNHIKDRCYNSKHVQYKNYGGRGIKICDEWLKDFKTFYNWAMVNGYKDDLTIDRINVNGNYEPSNCRWADMKTQSRNTRRNHFIPYKGETHCIAEWAEIFGIRKSTLYNRLCNLKWDFEKSLITPVQARTKRL